MELDQRTKFHHAANNSRELRMLKAQERIADNLDLIAQYLGFLSLKMFPETEENNESSG